MIQCNTTHGLKCMTCSGVFINSYPEWLRIVFACCCKFVNACVRQAPNIMVQTLSTLRMSDITINFHIAIRFSTYLLQFPISVFTSFSISNSIGTLVIAIKLVAKYRLHAVIIPLNAKLNPICHLLALLGAHHILHISRVRVMLLYIVHKTNFTKA